jgi:hypothetical protein
MTDHTHQTAPTQFVDGAGMATLTPEAKAIFGKTYAVPDELWLEVFFSPTQASQAAGQAFLQR